VRSLRHRATCPRLARLWPLSYSRSTLANCGVPFVAANVVALPPQNPLFLPFYELYACACSHLRSHAVAAAPPPLLTPPFVLCIHEARQAFVGCALCLQVFMEAVLQELGLSVAARSAAEHASSSPSAAPPPAVTPGASAPEVNETPVPQAVQQLMLESFFDAEEGRERRAEQARTASAAGFAPIPNPCGPAAITGGATGDDTGGSLLSQREGGPASTLVVSAARTTRGAAARRVTRTGSPLGSLRGAADAQPSTGNHQSPAWGRLPPGDNQVSRASGPDQSRNTGGGHEDRGGGGSATPATVVEPAFEFACLLSYTQYAASTEAFVSLWMLSIVARWPQAVASAKRRRLNLDGADCSGAVDNPTEGTNATLKTWSTRSRTACAFANFVGRTVCLHAGDNRPVDAEIERGVRKFFTCLTPFTKLVIIAFLKCRRAGYAIAGGGKPLTAITLKDYTSALTFLFSEAKLDGPLGVVPLVKDCAERTSPWQMKGAAELTKEEAVREDPGTFVGNPMATADVRNFRGATNKEARQGGEQSLASAAVTPEVMEGLHAELVLSHLPPPSPVLDGPVAPHEGACAASSAAWQGAAPVSSPSASPAPTLRERAARRAKYSPPSVGQADMLTYIYYVVAFLTLARPVTINFLTFDDVTFPDMKLSENFEFFHKCVLWTLDVLGVDLGCTHECCLHPSFVGFNEWSCGVSYRRGAPLLTHCCSLALFSRCLNGLTFYCAACLDVSVLAFLIMLLKAQAPPLR